MTTLTVAARRRFISGTNEQFDSGELFMDRDELQRLLWQKPFQPFRVYVNDGRIYHVRPQMNLLAESFVKIGIPAADLPEPICDHTEFVWLKDIVRVELLPPSESVTIP
jgi:hypothetical protein